MNFKKHAVFSILLFVFLSISLNASSLLKTNWVPVMNEGITSVVPFKLLRNPPVLTVTPTGTNENSLTVEVNGDPGLKVFVNSTYVGRIGSNGKLTVTLDTSGGVGLKDFLIYYEDDEGYTSDTLLLVIPKGVDTLPPVVTMSSPASGAIVTDRSIPLVFTIADDVNGSGLDVTEPATITFSDTNKSYTLNYDAGKDQYRYVPDEGSPFPYGEVSFIVSAKDYFGNWAHKEFSIFIQKKEVLSATPIASPQTAYAPATIRFSPQVSTDNAIQRYYWDFNGDGSFERNDITANSYTWTYDTPGDYNVTLKVIDVNNKEFTGSTIVHILNTPPQVSVDSSPSNGEIPLTVNFVVTASDSDGIALYEWDFDGDGVYDYNSTSTGNTSYTYTTEGIFNAKLRVTDNRGAVSTYTTPTTKVIAATQGSPSVSASVSPLTGNAPLNVTFSANVTDPQDKGAGLYEWDFDGDGIYDYNSSSSASTSYTYESAGKFYPRIKVTTTDGRVTYDAAEVTVYQNVSLDVTVDTIDVMQAESTVVHTTTTAKSEMKVLIEDRDHNVIKVLQDWTVREAGSYDDSWDGTDESGAFVKEGDYYAVLLYKIGNEIKRLDLRDSTGGTRYSPNAQNYKWRTFAPFDNRPMSTTFSITAPSEVISFIGYDSSNTRVVTLRSREVLGRGTYVDNWNGLNEEGQLISPPPGRWFLYGIWGFRLADNVIYVKSGAHVSAVTATPPIYTPNSHEEDGKSATLKLHFSLNKEATIELEVFDAAEGVPVATRTFAGVPAGEQMVEFDGRDNSGLYLHPGKYSLGIRAVDENGYRSMMEYTVTRIAY